MKGLEPSTFCMASRRSSQLSYIRRNGRIIAPPRRGNVRQADRLGHGRAAQSSTEVPVSAAR